MRQTYFPNNALLRKYIQYISVYHSEEGKRDFFVFPNPGAGIALHKQHSFVQEHKNVFRSFHTETSAQLLHINRIDPVHVSDEGQKTIITIVFQPLGVNHFLWPDLSEIIAHSGNQYSYIDISPFSFSGFADRVFEQATAETQIEVIERFLLQKFREHNIPFLKESVELLMDFDKLVSIPAICKQVGTSPRNLSRLFNKHIGLSPVEFRNISQFRYSLYKKIDSQKKSLKDVCYESNYSDASYMVRVYRKFTGVNPGHFFDNVAVDNNFVFLAV